MKKEFPKGFLWGVAHSSHQVEGNNDNNDWWEWEEKGKTKERSGRACDSWNRYPIDHQLVEELGAGGLRMSLEWSRIEPEEGKFSDEAIEHYRKVLRDLKKRNVKRVVTLWHWTLPIWFSHKYGWHKRESIEYFTKYCEKVISALGEEIDIFLTINEPTVPLSAGYFADKFPPGKKNPLLFKKARANMIEAHKGCYEIIKKQYKNLPVGITQLYNFFEPFNERSIIYKYITEKIGSFNNHYFLDAINDYQDIIGIDYYFHDKIKFNLKFPYYKTHNINEKVSDFGWEIFPRGIYEVSMDAWERYNKPIYIFENGVADEKDSFRSEFIKGHLNWLHKALKRGADIRGYFHWSLLDNFEWCEGFSKKFGLCEMNYETMERKPRPSYYYYQKIIKQNGIEIKTKK
ncbi:MAG: glycoside hydrolase family 1 protein [Patescibacteria group bacterium]|nr:glycoside hydrolase family 1 protein [Patescibacteria group bacterium]